MASGGCRTSPAMSPPTTRPGRRARAAAPRAGAETLAAGVIAEASPLAPASAARSISFWNAVSGPGPNRPRLKGSSGVRGAAQPADARPRGRPPRRLAEPARPFDLPAEREAAEQTMGMLFAGRAAAVPLPTTASARAVQPPASPPPPRRATSSTGAPPLPDLRFLAALASVLAVRTEIISRGIAYAAPSAVSGRPRSASACREKPSRSSGKVRSKSSSKPPPSMGHRLESAIGMPT